MLPVVAEGQLVLFTILASAKLSTTSLLFSKHHGHHMTNTRRWKTHQLNIQILNLLRGVHLRDRVRLR